MQLTHNGIFISVEGIEGAGKSSAMLTITNWLKDKGINITTTREPGGTKIAEEIRQLILSHNEENIHFITELLLFFAARSQNIHNCILPALKSGNAVIADRFIDATFAYQQGGRGISEKAISILEKLVLNDLKPNLTILLDVTVDTGITRIKNRAKLNKQLPDRIEQEKFDFFTNVRNCYLQRAEKFNDRIVIVDANQSLQNVNKQLETILSEKLSKYFAK
jgi:dTMP kinase